MGEGRGRGHPGILLKGLQNATRARVTRTMRRALRLTLWPPTTRPTRSYQVLPGPTDAELRVAYKANTSAARAGSRLCASGVHRLPLPGFTKGKSLVLYLRNRGPRFCVVARRPIRTVVVPLWQSQARTLRMEYLYLVSLPYCSPLCSPCHITSPRYRRGSANQSA